MDCPENIVHVSLVAIPDAVISILSGIYDVLSLVPVPTSAEDETPPDSSFHVDIVAESGSSVMLASGLPIHANRNIDEVARTDIVIVPSVLVRGNEWKPGRYPRLVSWLGRMHENGAVLCSACSGIFLLAETGLFDGKETTVHWNYARVFKQTFPNVPTNPERALVATGRREDLVSSGASASWHDLVLYLITRYMSPITAQSAAKFFALQWHKEGLAPYIVFEAPADHDDAVVAHAQSWLATHFSIGSPVDEMVKRSGMPERSFKRRFSNATGYSPISYVQRLRIEDAKKRLEQSKVAVDEISWKVGYEDPAFFRRLFKRITGITPASYRRKFQIPKYDTGDIV